MSPKEYLDRYTNLVLTDPVTTFPVTVNINGYGSGWGPEAGCNRKDVGPGCSREYNLFFVAALRIAHHGTNTPIGSDRFYFNRNQVPNLEPTEEFYVSSFINAFVGKGSPDEICDTLRVARAIGRIGVGQDPAGHARNKVTVQQYADAFMTLDCNGLVGNFYGINPNTPVSAYANASRRRMRGADIRVGDAVVTLSEVGKFEHVALIAEWTYAGPADTGTAGVKLVEWGERGNESKHYTGLDASRVSATRGPNKNYGIGFPTPSGTKFRYIFAPPQIGAPRGW